ncbi:MAG: CotH kinase family protein [Lachnospiraceae bacterium]|nr:CotH kinase family protein [Lachnospiraceae bacterium]
MSTHKQIDKICCGVLVLVLLLTVFLVNASKLGVVPVTAQTGYASRLFDDSKVHVIDIVMDDWDSFIKSCENEEYSACALVIDGEPYKNIGIRAKGNTSLSSVKEYGNNRYSFKIEFDCYESGNTYHGLDKISLNNLIQDNTYMKDYLTYRMMGEFGVSAPLCSYAFIRVNGEDWGLYLAVEGVEESFLQRNYGSDYGNLYKPDSMDMGGGRGNGGRFNPDDIKNFMEEGDEKLSPDEEPEFPGEPEMREPFGQRGEMPEMPFDLGRKPEFDDLEEPSGFGGRGGMSMRGNDVALIYSDDSYDSYQNIFDNAKTKITDGDKDRLIHSLKNLSQEEEIENVVDVDAVLRYFVVHNFVCNFDSYTGTLMHNYYLYEKDGKLSMIPWDYNLAFGGFDAGSGAGSGAGSMVNYPIDTPVSGTGVEERPMLAWIFADEGYTESYHQYFAEFLKKYFYSGYLEEMITEAQTLIAPYVEQDPTKFCSYEEFEKGIAALKDFCLLRAESVEGQLAGEIPTTTEGQKESPDALIDASGVSLSDMGTMDRGMGRGGRKK